MKSRLTIPASKLLPAYRRVLAKYESDGNIERAAIQRRLIKRLERMK